MRQVLAVVVAILAMAVPEAFLGTAWAQKSGGILRITHRDSPASMSIHEEGTISMNSSAHTTRNAIAPKP